MSSTHGFAPSNSSIITVAALIQVKKGEVVFIQNLGTNHLFVKRGTGASTTSFHEVLNASAVQDNGTGGKATISDFVGYLSFAGTSVRYMAWKR
jgi:hypothetical protein